jgi:hypothetical protein
MEAGENRVRVFYGTEREKEKDSRYIQEASAPAAVTVYQTCNIMYICNTVLEYEENRVHKLRYRETREGERRGLYTRGVPLTVSPASGQLYIYLQHFVLAKFSNLRTQLSLIR